MRVAAFLTTVSPHWAGLRLNAVCLHDQQLIVDLSSTHRSARCPDCQQRSRRAHSWFTRLLADAPLGIFTVHLRLHARRYRCDNAGCPRQTFRFASACRRWHLPIQRRTPVVRQRLEAIGFALGGQAGQRLARHLRLHAGGTSRNPLLRLMRRAVIPCASELAPNLRALRALRVDDFAFRRGSHYGAIVVDLDQHRVLDLLPNRDAAMFASWLEQHHGQDVQVISRDRGEAFADGARQAASRAVHVADRFHLLQNLGQALDQFPTREHRVLTAAADAVRAAAAKEQAADGEASSPGALQAAGVLMTRLEREHAAVEARRPARFAQVVALAQEGHSLREVARRARSTRRPCRGRFSALRPVTPGTTSQVKVPATAWIPVATIPALVSEEQFEQVQAKLAQNQQQAARHNTVHTYLLRALVSCGHCRQACTGRCASPGYPYYVCNGKMPPLRSSRTEKCPARFTPAYQLDALLWQDLCEVLTHPARIAQALEQARGGQWLPQQLQARRAQVQHATARLQSQVERLTDASVNQVMPLEEYQHRRQAVEQQLHAVARQVDQLEAEARRQQDLDGVVQSVEAFCARVRTGLTQVTWERKRQLVDLLIDRVVVTDADGEIHYVIPTTPASEHVRSCHVRTDYFHAVLVLVDGDELLVGELGGIEDVRGDQEGGLAAHRPRDGGFVDGEGSLNLPLDVLRGGARPRPAAVAVLGLLDELRLHREPLRTLFQLLGKGCLRSRRAGQAMGAQMPPRVRPLLPCLVHLPTQCCLGPLLTLGGAHHDPAFAGASGAIRDPEQVTLLSCLLASLQIERECRHLSRSALDQAAVAQDDKRRNRVRASRSSFACRTASSSLWSSLSAACRSMTSTVMS